MAFLRSFVSQQLLFYFQNIWIQWRMRRIVGLVKQIFAFWYLPAKKLHSSSTSPSRMTSILEHFPSAQELHPDGDQVYFMIRPFSFQTSMVLPFFKTMLTQSSWPSGMYINNSSFVRLPWKMVRYKSDRKWDAPLCVVFTILVSLYPSLFSGLFGGLRRSNSHFTKNVTKYGWYKIPRRWRLP